MSLEIAVVPTVSPKKAVYDHEDQDTSGLSSEMATRHREEMQRRTTTLMERRLDEYIDPLKKSGIEVEGHLEIGNPRQLIVQKAISIGADLLIIGSHSKRGLIDTSLGGTARQISTQAPCQVVLVSPKP